MGSNKLVGSQGCSSRRNNIVDQPRVEFLDAETLTVVMKLAFAVPLDTILGAVAHALRCVACFLLLISCAVCVSGIRPGPWVKFR